LLAEKYAEELVLRFFFLHSLDDFAQSRLTGFNQRLDDNALYLAKSFSDTHQQLERVFTTTFDLIYETAGVHAFRRYDSVRDQFSGGFLNTAFEVVGMGLGFHVARGSRYRTDVREAAKELWARPEFSSRFATGVSTEKRLSLTIGIGRELMAAS
jgi:hypothetical protein